MFQGTVLTSLRGEICQTHEVGSLIGRLDVRYQEKSICLDALNVLKDKCSYLAQIIS